MPFGKDDDFAGRLRPTGHVQPVKNKAEGRPSSKNGGKEGLAASKMVASKMADRDRDEALPYRIQNGSQRFQRPTDRRAEQEWSSAPHCSHGSAVESRDGSHDNSDSLFRGRENSGSLFPTDTQVSGQERRTEQERATGARPRTGQYQREHAQSVQWTGQARYTCRPGGNAGESSGLRVISCQRDKMRLLTKLRFVTVHGQDQT